MPQWTAALLAIAIPLIVILVVGTIAMRIAGRRPRTATSTTRARLTRAFGMLLLPTIVGLLALVSAAPNLATDDVRPTTLTLTAFGTLLGVGGVAAEVFLWRRLRRAFD